MLYETERVIAENGYKGIFKYFYSGYREIKKLLFLPPVLLSFLYNDFSEKQHKKRIARIRTVKTVIYLLAIASFAALVYALSGVLPYIAAFIASFAVAVVSVFVFGIIVQALNNFFEDKITPARLDYPLSESQLDMLRDTYFISAGEKLMDDVTGFVSYKEDAEHLFASPGHYRNGLFVKARMQMLIEILYLRAVETRMKDAQELLIDFMYAFYARFDSVILQELMTYHSISDDISENKKKDIVQFYFFLNDIMFQKKHPKDRLTRIKNQNELGRLLLIIEKGKEDFSWDTCLNIIEERKFGSVTAQLLVSHFMEITGLVPLDIFGKYLSSGELNDVKNALSSIPDRSAFLKELEKLEIPREISQLYIRSTFSVSDIFGLLADKENPIEFRLYALFTLSRHSCPSTALRALVFDGMNASVNIMESCHYEKPVVDRELSKELIKESKKYIERIKRQKPGKGNDYFNAVNAETVFTALSVIAHKGSREVDLIDFLRQLKYTFGKGNEVEFVVNLSGSRDPESFTAPLKNTEKYFETLNTVVEEVKVSLGL